MYDLKLIPISQLKGLVLPKMPGFIAAAPPRRAARSRAEDLLILSFVVSDSDRVTASQQSAWLENLIQLFFKTGGSVTAALQSLIETLNLTMMEKNLKSAKSGVAVTGVINAAAVHGRSLYVVQSGQVHAFTLTKHELKHFYDASRTDRGLGISRAPKTRYFHADLGEGGYLFMTDTPPETWREEQLTMGGFPNLEQLRRRLLNQASPDIRLDLVQIKPGDGEITTLETPAPAQEELQQRMKVGETENLPVQIDDAPVFEEQQEVLRSEDTQKMGVAVDEDWGAFGEIAEPEHLTRDGETPQTTSETHDLPADDKREGNVLDDERAAFPLDADAVAPVLSEENDLQDRVLDVPMPASEELLLKEPDRDQTKKERVKRERAQKLESSFEENVEILRQESLQGLRKFFDWRHKTEAKTNRVFRDLLTKLGLTDEEGLSKLSNRTLLTIATVVPLAVVALALGVYLSRGKTLQYQYYLEQAELASIVAVTSEDPLLAREAWAETALFLDQAASYRRTNEVTQKRAEAQRALDFLDGAARMSFHPVIAGTLADGIYITRMISYGLDLYLLDAANGQVIHATRSSKGYLVDSNFNCQAGVYGAGAVEALVDMVSLPINNPYQAHILAADALGNLIFCGPGQPPKVQTLPQGNKPLGAVTRIASEGDRLYVFDRSGEAVHVYLAENGQYIDPPNEYFGDQSAGQKPSLAGVVDLAVNGPNLYLLKADGKLINCVATGLPGNPFNCDDPVEFVDGRPGKEEQPVSLLGSSFVSILYTPPPVPAINILDGENADIFRFSMRFRLDTRLRSDFGDYELTTPAATAFTIGVDRTAFIAFGNQVFYAYVE